MAVRSAKGKSDFTCADYVVTGPPAPRRLPNFLVAMQLVGAMFRVCSAKERST